VPITITHPSFIPWWKNSTIISLMCQYILFVLN
jgi:hypothetical protein